MKLSSTRFCLPTTAECPDQHCYVGICSTTVQVETVARIPRRERLICLVSPVGRRTRNTAFLRSIDMRSRSSTPRLRGSGTSSLIEYLTSWSDLYVLSPSIQYPGRRPATTDGQIRVSSPGKSPRPRVTQVKFSGGHGMSQPRIIGPTNGPSLNKDVAILVRVS